MISIRDRWYHPLYVRTVARHVRVRCPLRRGTSAARSCHACVAAPARSGAVNWPAAWLPHCAPRFARVVEINSWHLQILDVIWMCLPKTLTGALPRLCSWHDRSLCSLLYFLHGNTTHSLSLSLLISYLWLRLMIYGLERLFRDIMQQLYLCWITQLQRSHLSPIVTHSILLSNNTPQTKRPRQHKAQQWRTRSTTFAGEKDDLNWTLRE